MPVACWHGNVRVVVKCSQQHSPNTHTGAVESDRKPRFSAAAGHFPSAATRSPIAASRRLTSAWNQAAWCSPRPTSQRDRGCRDGHGGLLPRVASCVQWPVAGAARAVGSKERAIARGEPLPTRRPTAAHAGPQGSQVRGRGAIPKAAASGVARDCA